jgi:hypothetical protein
MFADGRWAVRTPLSGFVQEGGMSVKPTLDAAK